MLDTTTVKNRINSIFAEAFKIEAPERAPVSLKQPAKHQHTMGPGRPRPSGFPYCPVRHIYKDLVEGQETTSLEDTYYKAMGTTAHLVFQRFMALTGHCIGNYGCPRCGHFHVSRDPYCPRCRPKYGLVECEYHELEAKKGEVFAHIDGLLDLDELGKWVIDYKTTALRMKGSALLPYMKNQHQGSAYVPILEENLSIKIEGFALIYVPRDAPIKFETYVVPMSDRKKELALGRIKTYTRQSRLADKYSKNLDPELLHKIVRDKPCKDWSDAEKLHHLDCPIIANCLSAHKQSNEKVIKFICSLT